MKPIRPPRTWRHLSRVLAALGLAGAVTVTGLPGGGIPAAFAANKVVISGGKRCDKFHLGREYGTTPRNSGFPSGSSNFDTWQGNPKNYNYDLPGKAFDGLKQPTAAEQAKALSQVPGDLKKNADKWSRVASASGAPVDRAMAIYARFLATKRPVSDFKTWFDNDYIIKQENNRKGAAFEGRLVKDFNLIGPDWLCEVDVKVFDENGKQIASRRYDAYNKKTLEFNEFKSNSLPREDQIKADRTILKEKPDHTLRYSGGKKWDPKDVERIKALDKEISEGRPGKTNQVRGFQRQYNGIPRTKPIRGYSQEDKWFAPDPNKGTRGPANDRVNRSAPNPETARRQQGAARQVDVRGTLPRGGPGGVDFTTLELRYVGGLAKGRGMQYSMKADMVKNPDTDPGWGGKAKMQLASDAMFTWLALTPDKFWVNLNPDEPDRIMDSTFASTDAGRVLLDADLQMKHDFYKAMDPETDLGKRYWAALPKENGNPCMPGLRNWIEPKPAKVREQDGGIYILDAPLALKSTAQKTVTQGPGEPLCDPDEQEIKAAQRVVDTMIVPAVEKIINTAPQYADLRRVYTSRVAAEYIRQQDAKKPTDFHSIIDSNNVKRWPLRSPNQNWDKNELFQRYRKIFREGEFTYDVGTDHGVQVIIVGGVDFSKSPKQNITKTRFNVENRTLDTTTKTSMESDDTSYRDTDDLYMGGRPGDATGGGGGDDPTPTPTHTGKPTPTPTHSNDPLPVPTQTPGNSPSTPPDGDLADTGNNTPIGLVSGIAAALVAAGGALAWWMRRRRASTQ